MNGLEGDQPEQQSQCNLNERSEEYQEPTACHEIAASITGRRQDRAISYFHLPNKGQLAVLCLSRMIDPLAHSSVESYIFYQLRVFSPSATDAFISTQAGTLISAKTAAHVCTGMLWGRAADSERGGRKLVLIVGLVSCAISYIGFGLSRSFVQALAWQVFGGAFSNNVAVTRCVVAELNPEKRYRVRALLLLPLFANAGNFIGPLVGGFLSSNAATSPPETYPFLLPNLVVALIYLIVALGVFTCLGETLDIAHYSAQSGVRRDSGNATRPSFSPPTRHPNYGSIGADESSLPATPAPESIPVMPRWSKRKRKLAFGRMWTFNVVCTLLSQFIISGHVGTFPVLWAVFLSTPKADSSTQGHPFRFSGGLGMHPGKVGFAMSLLGALGIFLQLVVYPIFQDRFGTIKIWRNALMIFPLAYLIAPYPSLVASTTSPDGQGPIPFVWLSIGLVTCCFIFGKTGVTPATTLLINDCTPHPSVRATIHAAATVVGNLSRSVFPMIVLAIFGRGLAIGVIGLAFWSLSGLAALAYVVSLWVIEGSNGAEIILCDSDTDEEDPS